MGSPADKRAIQAGQLRRHRSLGLTSEYRVVREHDEIVVMEAVDVPGLGAGERVCLTRTVVDAMDVVDVSRSDSRPGISDAA
jgi:hypothetical protein